MACYRVHRQVLSQRMADEVVLVHLGTDRIQVLNRTAARLWELLAEGLEVAEIKHRMLIEFEVDEADLAAETDRLVQQLVEARLIVPADDG